MTFKKTKIDGLYIIEPEFKTDERGDFARTFCKEELAKNSLGFDIAQVNQSTAKQKGTIRGMHFQTEPKEEGKIVQCLSGKIFDVAIDLRKNSLTYGQWVSEELTSENKKMFFIPKGFAHGFQALSDNCVVQYFMSEFYSPKHASGARYSDQFFNIKWPIENCIVSEKDKNWPLIQK